MGFRVQGFGFRVQGLGFRVLGLGCCLRVQGLSLDFRIYILETGLLSGMYIIVTIRFNLGA